MGTVVILEQVMQMALVVPHPGSALADGCDELDAQMLVQGVEMAQVQERRKEQS